MQIKVGTLAGISDDIENLRVNRDDFLNALEEVQPAFGVSKEELEQVVQNGIIHYGSVVDVRIIALRETDPILIVWIGNSSLWSTVRGPSLEVNTYANSQRSVAWSSGFRQDRVGCDHCTSFTVSVHEAPNSGQHGRLLGGPESRGDHESI